MRDTLEKSLETIRADFQAQKDATNLVLASRLFKDTDRLHIFSSLYAFMRRIDDLVDQVAERDCSENHLRNIEHRLRYWENIMNKAYSRDEGSGMDENAHFLKKIFNKMPIPQSLWKHFFKAMWMDLKKQRFPDEKTFLSYAEGASVAATTIYLMLIGYEKQEDGRFAPLNFDYLLTGRLLGVWAYSVHLMRDMKEDILAGNEGRLLIPESLLKRYRLSIADMRHFADSHFTPETVRKMVIEFLDWGDTQFGYEGKNAARVLMTRIPLNRAKVLGVIVSLYAEMNRRIRMRGGDVFSKRPLFTGRERKKYVIGLVKKKSLPDIWGTW